MELQETTTGKLYYDGCWQEASGTSLRSINPATGKVVWEGKSATPSDVQSAFHSAKKALANYSKQSLQDRIATIYKFKSIVEKHKDTLSELIAIETGKPMWEAKTEAQSVIAKVDISIDAYKKRTPDSELEAPLGATGFIRYKPHGVVAILGPFNFPAHLSNGHIIPALLAGNTVLYKPSELTPMVAEFMIKCWHESGIKAGIINLVQGGVLTAKAILNQDVKGVYFTGSYQTGLRINQQLSDRPEVILALEMGGNNPLVIDSVKNIEAAVYQTILSSFISAGQRCTCARKVIVPNNSFGDNFVQAFIKASQNIKIGAYTGNPEPFMGPIISYEAAKIQLANKQKLIAAGARELLEMQSLKVNTGFLSPGIIEMSDALAFDEEFFSPLVQLYRYDNFDEAISIANNTQYGLSAALFTDNADKFTTFYEQINAGLINLNRTTTGALSSMPFGGIGHSGNHRPSAYFAADYAAYPVAGLKAQELLLPEKLSPGISL